MAFGWDDARCSAVDARDLRSRLTELLGFAVAPASELVVRAESPREGYVEQAVSFAGDEGAVPGLLLRPEHPCGAGIVVHHQHHGQWHLGKSEVAGLCGDRWQAFGPELARRGVTVIAYDAVGFEDRRPRGPGRDPRSSDADDYFTTMCYRLVRGRPLMSTVLVDAAAAHSALAALADVDGRRVGALGHSMGGASVLLHAALDTRVAFAAASGSACTYRERMARGTGIDCSQAIPGLLELGDLDDIAPLVAPRPLLLCSAEDDKYSADAPRIAAAAEHAYRDAGAPGALRHSRAHGGHALDAERFGAIVDWVTANMGEGPTATSR
ncbi:MAG: alpha/beta hydrolase family protein [Solirubrobacteraceae bacterium]